MHSLARSHTARPHSIPPASARGFFRATRALLTEPIVYLATAVALSATLLGCVKFDANGVELREQTAPSDAMACCDSDSGSKHPRDLGADSKMYPIRDAAADARGTILADGPVDAPANSPPDAHGDAGSTCRRCPPPDAPVVIGGDGPVAAHDGPRGPSPDGGRVDAPPASADGSAVADGAPVRADGRIARRDGFIIFPRLDGTAGDAPADAPVDAPLDAVADAGPDGPADAARPDAFSTTRVDGSVRRADAFSPDAAVTPSSRPVVVFSRSTANGYRLYTLDINAGTVASLTSLDSGAADDLHPTWCVLPDGNVYIVFESNRTAGWRLYRLDFLDPTSPPVAVTTGPLDDVHPQCAPSGRIYYHSGNDLWSGNPDGSDIRPVYADAERNEYPSPAADESEVVFASTPAGDGATTTIKKLLLDSSGVAVGSPVSLTPAGERTTPSRSPTELRVAFSDHLGSNFQIAVASSVDGSGSVPLSSPIGANLAPRFSRPDGANVVFQVTTSDGTSIALVPAGGSSADVILLTPVGSNDLDPELFVFPR